MPFGPFLPAKTPAAKLRTTMHKRRYLSASAKINLPQHSPNAWGGEKLGKKNVWVHNFLFFLPSD
jgi:hypothetical protein